MQETRRGKCIRKTRIGKNKERGQKHLALVISSRLKDTMKVWTRRARSVRHPCSFSFFSHAICLRTSSFSSCVRKTAGTTAKDTVCSSNIRKELVHGLSWRPTAPSGRIKIRRKSGANLNVKKARRFA